MDQQSCWQSDAHRFSSLQVVTTSCECWASGGPSGLLHLEMKPKGLPERWVGWPKVRGWVVEPVYRENIVELDPWGISCPLPCLLTLSLTSWLTRGHRACRDAELTYLWAAEPLWQWTDIAFLSWNSWASHLRPWKWKTRLSKSRNFTSPRDISCLFRRRIPACQSLPSLPNGPVTHRTLVSIPFSNHTRSPPWAWENSCQGKWHL